MVFRVFISSITEELTDTELDKIIFQRQDIVMHINEPHFLPTEVMSSLGITGHDTPVMTRDQEGKHATLVREELYYRVSMP